MEERWINIVKYFGGADKYEISTLGDVRNKKTKKIITSCQIEYNDGKRKIFRISKFMAAEFDLPNPNNYSRVTRKDESLWFTLDNIQWGTNNQNSGLALMSLPHLKNKIKQLEKEIEQLENLRFNNKNEIKELKRDLAAEKELNQLWVPSPYSGSGSTI